MARQMWLSEGSFQGLTVFVRQCKVHMTPLGAVQEATWPEMAQEGHLHGPCGYSGMGSAPVVLLCAVFCLFDCVYWIWKVFSQNMCF